MLYIHTYIYIYIYIYIHTHIHANIYTTHIYGLPGGSDGKESIYLCRRPRFDFWLGISPGEGNGNSLQDSCLENPMHRGARQVIVLGHKESHMTE